MVCVTLEHCTPPGGSVGAGLVGWGVGHGRLASASLCLFAYRHMSAT